LKKSLEVKWKCRDGRFVSLAEFVVNLKNALIIPAFTM
jgi:hypothetical protein